MIQIMKAWVMKKLLSILLLLLVSASMVYAEAGQITSREAKAMLDRNRNAYLLDVRTPEEFRQASLKGAVLIPIGEFQRRSKEVPKGRPVIVYCAVGSRSRPVADFLAGQGYREVYNMSDGIVGWYRNGFPIVK